MSETAHGTVPPDRPPEPAALSVAAVPFGAAAAGDVKPGLIWHDLEIESAFAGVANAYVARDAAQNRKVIVQARLIDDTTPPRRAAWTQLCALDEPRILRCLDATEEAGWRYEQTALPSSTTLREWIACHQSGFQEVEAFVRQLAPAIAALHAKGVGHFAISPDFIYIEESDSENAFVLGGLHAATIVDQPGLIPIGVDPFYAPPEAAGLTQHQAGVRLYAWDWWSLGRVVQEFLIGRHVLGLLLDREVTRPTPELRAAAEQLLLEREPPGVRAGGVEHMSAEPASLVLLRGLLTGSCDARWGLHAIQRWLRREQVREYYDLPRTARLWIWKERALTLVDAAEIFTQSSYWAEGIEMLFEADRPDTLAHFLRETPAHRTDWECLDSIRQMTASGGWQQIPAGPRQSIAAAIGWLALTNGSGTRGTFRICGQTIDSPGLAELLRHPGGPEGVALFNALLLPAVIEFLETMDSTAGRVLKGLAVKAGGAARLAVDHAWLQPDNDREFARLLNIALERSVVLQDRHALLQSAYATSRNPDLARILAEKTPAPAELVISAFTGEQPDQYGYITHREWRHERYVEFRSRAEAVTAALLWIRLQRLLNVARLWSAPWPVFVGVSLGLSALAGWLNRSFSSGAMVAVVVLLGRVWLVVRVRNAFRRVGDRTPAWGWRDGIARARREAARVKAGTHATIGSLTAQLEAARGSMSGFVWENRGRGVVQPYWWDLTGMFSLATCVIVAVLLRGLTFVPVPLRSAITLAIEAVTPAAAPQKVHVETNGTTVGEVVADPAHLLATGRYDVVDDGFGRRLRGPLRRWDHFAPREVARLVVNARAPALPEQAAYAVVSASLLLQPYVRDSVVGLLAVRVPTTRGFGIVVFNTRDRQLIDHDVLLLERPVPLVERTWYALDHRRVLYLGTPLPLNSEISLAPW